MAGSEHRRNAENLFGMNFGYWRVEGRAKQTSTGQSYWVCLCKCGNIRLVAKKMLQTGRSKSCGCQKSELISRRVKTHGMTNSRLFRIWKGMLERCHKENNKDYHRYGDKGILVCDRWRGPTGFSAFMIDMGNPGDDSKLTIDRIDGSKGYSPENCRWATQTTQHRNKCNNRILTLNGRSLVIAEWAEITGLKRCTISKRLNSYGWSVEKTLTTPAYPRNARK